MDGERDGVLMVRVPRWLALAVAAVVFFFGFAEGIQRLSDWRKEAKRAHRVDPYSIRGETPAGHSFKSDPRALLVMELHPHLLVTTRADQQLPGLRVNAQGFRGDDWVVEKPPGTLRVIVLGGSTTFGKAATDDGATFSARLQSMLEQRRGSDRAVEVLNAGVMGYDSTQEYILLATRLLDYRPDLILLFDGWNDFYFGGVSGGGEDVDHPLFVRLDHAIGRGGQTWRNLFRLSAFYRALERKIPRWLRRLGWSGTGPHAFGHFQDNRLALERYRRNLSRIIHLARSWGIEVLIAPQPELFQRRGPIPDSELRLRQKARASGYADLSPSRYPEYVAAAAAVAEAEGVAFASTAGIFDDVEGEIFVDPVHLTDRGHEIVARHLTSPVAAALGLEPAPTD